jgi:shikimate kinase
MMGAGKTQPGKGGEESIALIGFMGAGKSAAGTLLAAKLGMTLVDLDEVVSGQAGMSVEEIFRSEGQDGFRIRESEALRMELKTGEKVISCGGGVVLRDENIELLRRKCRIYLLEISKRAAIERLDSAVGRPLLEGGDLGERVGKLMEERSERYVSAAHEVIDADDATPEEIAEEIAARWQRYRSEQRGEHTRSM